MELMVISNPVAVAGEHIIINNLFQAGLKYFHIRKPDSDISAVRNLLNAIDPCFYDRIALHQFHQVAEEFGIKRLHYSEQMRKTTSPADLQLQMEQGYVQTTSIHDITLLPSLKQFYYIFYGPVFNSISKPGYQSNVPEDFYLTKPETNPMVIALGGVTSSNLDKVKKLNFDGAAVLGTIWNDPDRALTCFMDLKEKMNLINQHNDR